MNLAQVFPEAQADESWMQTQWEGEAVKDVFRTRPMAREGSKTGPWLSGSRHMNELAGFSGYRPVMCFFMFDWYRGSPVYTQKNLHGGVQDQMNGGRSFSFKTGSKCNIWIRWQHTHIHLYIYIYMSIPYTFIYPMLTGCRLLSKCYLLAGWNHGSY